MGGKKHKEEAFVPAVRSDYEDMTPAQEKQELNDLKEKYRKKDGDIPPLSVREKEHLTYIMVTARFNEARNKRSSARKYGSLFIIISGIVFLTLIFSLDAKIETLCLWIITILFCVVYMIKADYNYYNYKEILGRADENDFYEMDDVPEESSPAAERNE